MTNLVPPTPGRAPLAMTAEAESAMLARNGITRVPADQFHVDGYRYSNLADALAQVTRRAGGRRDEA